MDWAGHLQSTPVDNQFTIHKEGLHRLADQAKVLQRFSINHNQVSDFTRTDRAKLGLNPHRPGAYQGRCPQRVSSRKELLPIPVQSEI